MKVCSKCRVKKPLGDFSFKKSGEPALKSACKECSAADTRARYAANPAPRLEYAKVSRKSPAVRRRINDRRNKLRRLNPALELWRLAKVRARTKCLPFDIEVADVIVPEVCPALGIVLRWGVGKRQMDESPTLDRLVPERGYVKGNVSVISWRANRIKSDATLAELAAVVWYVSGQTGVSSHAWPALGVAITATHLRAGGRV